MSNNTQKIKRQKYNNMLHTLSSSSSMINQNSITFSLITFLLFISKTRATHQLAPALYVLGDSLLDCGNNNFLQTIIKANYLPYGIDFPNNNQNNGRFTNGNTVADLIAEFLGLPNAPPFLSFSPGDSLPLTGLNYASGACGILPQTGREFGKCLSFEEQVGLFQQSVELLKKQRNFNSSEELSEYLSKSIFIISIGNNDYINNDTAVTTTSLHKNKFFAQQLIDKLSLHLQRLYKLGARKIVVFEIGPLGCAPAMTRKIKHRGKCVEDINQFLSYFNNMIPTMLQNLRSNLKGSSFVHGLVYRQAYDAIINPSKYGIINANTPCCATFPVTLGGVACIPQLSPCNHRDEFYFWDGFHPTQVVYSSLANLCITNSSICSPFSIKELVQI